MQLLSPASPSPSRIFLSCTSPPPSSRASSIPSLSLHTLRVAPQSGGGRWYLSHRRAEVVRASQASVAPASTPSMATDVVFVAGSTGKVGSRTVRELLKLGFQVRAGVRSAQRAESLVQSVQRMEAADASGSQPIERLQVVECDLEKRESIAEAIGNASAVICCIGASEKEIFDITGPFRIDYMATKNLIDAAAAKKVEHFILLTSLGTNKIGFPAALLNLFWGVLVWKRKAEEALFDSGIPYTIVRPGGMERPTDSFKETHNLVLASEDTYFGGLVSNLQVAELMACMAKNRELSFCKVVEVIAETTAPLLPAEELLLRIPSKRPVPASLKNKPRPPPTAAPESPEPSGVSKTRPSSPFFMYEDLKPPSSPTPSAPSLPEEPKPAAETAPSSSTPLSPYTTYEEMKPPSSPSPSAPSADSSNGPAAAPPKNDRPLSPYTMYEDMKPPTSPVPSVPKI